MKPILLALLSILFLEACASRSVTYEPQADREGIRQVIRRGLPSVSKCYERAIDERPGAEGKVVMNWDIGPDGRATNVTVKEAGPKIEMIGPCLANLIGSWKFPKPNKEELHVNVSYPFIFSENGRFHE